MDNFLPCIINETGEEDELQAAIMASMGGTTATTTSTTTTNAFSGTGYTLSGPSSDGSPKQQQQVKKNNSDNDVHGSSKYDPFCMSDKNRQVLANTENFLQQQQSKPVNPYAKKPPPNAATAAGVAAESGDASLANVPSKLDRIVTTHDLAYSKAKNMQTWVRENTISSFFFSLKEFISLDCCSCIFSRVGALFGKSICQKSWFVSSH